MTAKPEVGLSLNARYVEGPDRHKEGAAMEAAIDAAMEGK